MHKVETFDAGTLSPHPKYAGHATGLNWSPFVEHADDTVHISYGVIEVLPGGETELTIQAHETGMYLLEGEIDVIRDGRCYRLVTSDFMLIPTGVEHAYRNSGSVPVRWIEMCAPQPKAPDAWQDTWFAGTANWPETPALINLADRRDQMVGHYDYAQHTPPLTITPDLDGFSQRMMIDDVFGAVHFNMFVISFADGGICNHHDHAFEEAYYVLGGEVDIVFDGQDYLLKAGDFAWTGVGAQHAFFPRKGTPVHWLEIQAPQPPLREGVRFHRPWDELSNVLSF